MDRLVGVEWEYNHDDFRMRELARKHGGDVHRDGSCGYEYVTKPLTVDQLKPILSNVANLLSTYVRRELNINSNCSVHVHVDARDITWKKMAVLLRLYSRVENALYWIGGHDRRSNRYCRPCKLRCNKIYNDKDAIIRHVYSNQAYTPKQMYKSNTDKKQGNRYFGMNILPWVTGRKNRRKDTTVEFRIHEATADANRVLEWCRICRDIVDYANSHSLTDLKKLSKNPYIAIRQITGNKTLPSNRKQAKERYLPCAA